MYFDRKLLSRYCSELIELSPDLYVSVMRYRKRHHPGLKRIVANDTRLVVEGFPRCANSFTVMAIRSVNDPIKIATHLHSAGHIFKGIKCNIPTLVVIRNPDNAIPSLLALGQQLGKVDSIIGNHNAQVAYVRYWTSYYRRFYERLCSVRDQFVLAEFKGITTDLNQYIIELNEKYGEEFTEFNHTEENVAAIFSKTKVHLSPSKERDQLKEAFTRIYFDGVNSDLRAQAAETYTKIISL